MRYIRTRPDLPVATTQKLQEKTDLIARDGDAQLIYQNSRDTQWFSPVIEALKFMAGPGGCCMLCSRSEGSDVEHYRPKAIFPDLAMTWENYLWSCAICNRAKSNRFPPDTEPGGRMLNPVEDNPWDHLFINELMMITPRIGADLDGYDPRGLSTRDILRLNRDALIESRRERHTDLTGQVESALQGYHDGKLSVENLRSLVGQLRVYPFHLDVAEYFLDGPGQSESPFRELFELLTT